MYFMITIQKISIVSQYNAYIPDQLQILYWYMFVRKNNLFYYGHDYQTFLVYIGLCFESSCEYSDNLFLYSAF